ncbi:hypothetical protein HYV10_01480 [Candidatus Dependentiae bacterium]|nr:hypothetical protein [Candidatus Dependentiae bacterium]
MKSYNQQLALCGFLLISGLFFSGCEFFKKSDKKADTALGSGEVLMSIDGVPVLTADEYEQRLEMARKANPQIEMFLQIMPNAERELIFRGISMYQLMKAWADKEGISNTPEFKEQQKHMHEAMDMQLFMKHFDDAHPVQVSDGDIENYYHEKKDMVPGLMQSAGGVETLYVRFESKAKAQHFFDKVKDIKKMDTFKKVAEEHKNHVGQSVINEKSPFSEALKKSVLDLKKFPSIQMVKVSDDAYWVVFASGKTEAKYHDLKSPQVQQGLRKMIEDERKTEQAEKIMDQLKKDLNVVENKAYFDDKEAKKRAQQQADVSANEQESNEEQDLGTTKV